MKQAGAELCQVSFESTFMKFYKINGQQNCVYKNYGWNKTLQKNVAY